MTIVDTNSILEQRETIYGSYQDKADLIQFIKHCFRSYDGWYELDADMQESLDMIASKIGRIVIGSPYHIDNWIDIAGYSQLISNRLQSTSKQPSKKTKNK